MNPGILMIEQNLGMSLEMIILLVVVLFGGLVFFAKNFSVGLVIDFGLSAALFMWYYYAGWNFVPPLIVMLIMFVLMCMSFYATSKVIDRGGFI